MENTSEMKKEIQRLEQEVQEKNVAEQPEPRVGKRMSYGNIGCILRHMNANKRLEISLHCPTLRVVEKSTPLIFDQLTFHKHHVTINDISYRLGVHIDLQGPCNGAMLAYRIKAWNDFGGLPYDIDMATFKAIPNGPNPGDVDLQQRKHELDADTCDLDRVPFKAYIQLTIDSPSGIKIHRSPYNIKLYEAKKLLVQKLLGGRGPLEVRSFDFENDALIRLPVGFKLKVKHFGWMFEISKLIEQILPILDYSGLESLHLYLDHFELKYYRHPFIRDCPKLTFHNSSVYVMEDQVEIFDVLPKHVEVTYRPLEDGWKKALDPVALVRQWIRANREIGTFFSFCYDHDGFFKGFFRDLSREFCVVPERYRKDAMTISMNGTKNINVWIDSQLDQNQEKEWGIMFEIVARRGRF